VYPRYCGLPILCFCLIFSQVPGLQAQVLELIQTGNSGKDSSYYDIFRFSASSFWIGGKYGILKEMNLSGDITDISYPNQGVSILRVNRFYEGKLILAADQGIIYTCENNQWSINKFNKYSKYCFYDICVTDSLTAYVCGGKSKIAYGERTIPYGFVLKTEDGGRSWKKIYSSWHRMVWRVREDPEKRQIMILTYSPSGSRVFASGDAGESWKKTSLHSHLLWYDMDFAPEGVCILSGGRSGNLNKQDGYISKNHISNTKKNKSSPIVFESGLIWNYAQNNVMEIAGGSKGNLLFRSKNKGNAWTCLKTKIPVNLYEVSFIDERSAFVIGSNKTIYRLTLPAPADAGLLDFLLLSK